MLAANPYWDNPLYINSLWSCGQCTADTLKGTEEVIVF